MHCGGSESNSQNLKALDSIARDEDTATLVGSKVLSGDLNKLKRLLGSFRSSFSCSLRA